MFSYEKEKGGHQLIPFSAPGDIGLIILVRPICSRSARLLTCLEAAAEFSSRVRSRIPECEIICPKLEISSSLSRNGARRRLLPFPCALITVQKPLHFKIGIRGARVVLFRLFRQIKDANEEAAATFLCKFLAWLGREWFISFFPKNVVRSTADGGFHATSDLMDH